MKLSISAILILISTLSHAEICDTSYADQEALRNRHNSDSFNTTRGLTESVGSGTYARSLHPNFNGDQRNLGPGQVWFDSGGGDGIAAQDYRKGKMGSMADVVVVSFETKLEPSPGIKVLKGRLLEDIPNSEIGMVDLITDVYGPFAYTSHPEVVISKYLQLLKIGGKAHIAFYDFQMIDASGIVGIDGTRVSLIDMIKSIPGIEVKMASTPDSIVDTTGIEITKVTEVNWRPPALKPLFHNRAAPPIRVMVDQAWNHVSAELARKAYAERNAQLVKSGKAKDNADRLKYFLEAKQSVLSEKIIPTFKAFLEVNPVKEWAHYTQDTEFYSKFFDAFRKFSKRQGKPKYAIGSLEFGPIQPVIGTPQLKVVRGLNDAIPPKSLDLLSDTGEGPFLNEGRPDVVLRRYLNSIQDKGSLKLFVGRRSYEHPESVILVKSWGSDEDRSVTLHEWLRAIPGIVVSPKVDSYGLVNVAILDRSKIVIPDLEFVAEIEKSSSVSNAVYYLERSR